MTVALILADQADAGLRGQLTALGVRRVDVTDRAGPAVASVAAAAQVAGERVLICAGDGTVPEEILARLLRVGGTAAFTRTGAGALVVDPQDLEALAGAAAAPAAPAAIGALIAELGRRGVRVRVLDVGPDGDGAVARLAVEPVAAATATWLARRQLTPAALYGIALGLGLLSAVWFADPSTRARVVGAVVLLGSLAAGRAGSLLAASEPGRERRRNPAVDWLGAASGLLSEFAVYAALAVASRPTSPAGPAGPAASLAGLDGVYGAHLRNTLVATLGGPGTAGVWRLAVAAMVMLGLRRIAWLCYEAAARSPANPYPGSVRRLGAQVISLPAGERYALIGATVILAGPRLTFLLLLAWGVAAVGYLLARPMPDPAEGAAARDGPLAAYRGDGVVAHRLGGIVRGTLPPLLPVFVTLFVICVLAFLGLANLPGALILLPVIIMLFPALGARHRHDGRLDWLAPPLIQTGECVFLAALGFSRHVAAPLVFALVAAVLLRHADLAYRARVGLGIAIDRFGLGWDGRMLLAGLAAAVGLAPFAYAALTGYLWLLFCWDYLGGWLEAPG
jgi:Family of unknown function (DUF5941)